MEDACIIPSKKKLDGKVAIVTGGASGIGEATARSFAAHGAHAIVIADVQDEKGENVAVQSGPSAAATSTATSPTRSESKP